MAPPAATRGASPPIAHHPPTSLHINTSTTASSVTSEAIRSHTYWSGFYKKTIKERRTQLGLAYPHLAQPTPLDSFASTQTSAKTSGRSTPNLGPTLPGRPGLTMTTMVLPGTPSATTTSVSVSASGLAMPRPLPLPVSLSRTNTALLQHNPTALALRLTSAPSKELSDNDCSSARSAVCTLDATLPQRDQCQEQEDTSSLFKGSQEKSRRRIAPISDEADQLLAPLPSPQDQQQTQDVEKEERRALAIELAQGQEDVLMTEEERRDQLEKERRATVILNLEEQRKMIGSPNGHLLEGDMSLDARLDAIIATEQNGAPFPVHGLDEQIANNMIENCIGTLGLPLGLAFNFTINDLPLTVPMAIEEPSVVAAVSSAAKTISAYQGFKAWAPERNMIVAQVQLLDIMDSEMDRIMIKMKEQEQIIREEANEHCVNMVLRGGGVQRVTFHRVRRHLKKESFKGQDLLVKYGVVSASSLPARGANASQGHCSDWLVVHLHIDVGDAMGANCANTVAEGIAPFLAKLSGGRVGIRILSNLNMDRIAKSTFRLPFSHMGYKSLPGKDVAVRILEAYEWADLDPYRAATHNKGIMNGIDAVALATGQDWRAVEAGAHAWAGGAGTYSEHSSETAKAKADVSGMNGYSSNHGVKRTFAEQSEESSKIYRGDAYKPLTRYWIEEDKERLLQGYRGQDALVFCGELEIPIMVGTKGGVLSTNPVHAFTLGVMRYPDSKQLAMAMVTVGLAQNFAALRALVTEGIQRGHMSLHARNIAISAGTPPASVDEVTAYMIDSGKIRLGAARSYLEKRGLSLYSAGASANSSNVSIHTHASAHANSRI
ncbi:hypothetical protein EDD11_006120 [Mortierella claussenii]|nr:hypothetical protein EDD11_006120 [Mortierella claussenii]